MTYSGGRDSASWKEDLFYYLVKDAETTIHMVMNYEFTHRSQVSLKFMMAEINNLSEERKRDRHTSKRKIRQDYKRVDFPGGSAGKESALRVPQWGRPGCDPWVGKIPGRKAWQPTSVFLPGESPWTEESGGLQSMGSQRVEHDWVTKHTQDLAWVLHCWRKLTFWYFG